MKKAIICLVLLLAVMPQIGGMADGGRMSLGEMLAPLAERSELNETDAQLLSDISGLLSCGGMYYHQPDEAPKKVYYADLEFYYRFGIPFCHIDYNNYMGTLSDAPVRRAEEDGWLFKVEAPCVHFSQEQTLTFLISADRIHVSWADDIEDDLTREPVEPVAVPFTQTERYELVCSGMDNLIGSEESKRSYFYNEEDREMIVYIELGVDPRSKPDAMAGELLSTWKTIVSSLRDASSSMQEMLNLAARDGLYDYRQARFTIFLVSKLEDKPQYHPENVLAVFSNGATYYDLLADKQ